jgi:hypothetical protein
VNHDVEHYPTIRTDRARRGGLAARLGPPSDGADPELWHDRPIRAYMMATLGQFARQEIGSRAASIRLDGAAKLWQAWRDGELLRLRRLELAAPRPHTVTLAPWLTEIALRRPSTALPVKSG